MGNKLTCDDCRELLILKNSELREKGEDRYPKRSDFSDYEVMAIKACFGPWPRALEAAGIKPPREAQAAARSLEKRIRTKRRINEKRRAERTILKEDKNEQAY